MKILSRGILSNKYQYSKNPYLLKASSHKLNILNFLLLQILFNPFHYGRIEVSAWRGNVQGEIMLGIIYLLLAGMLGCEASKMLTGEGRSVSGINRIWLILPASFVHRRMWCIISIHSQAGIQDSVFYIEYIKHHICNKYSQQTKE